MDNVIYACTVDLDEGENTTFNLGGTFPDFLITETSHTLQLTLLDSAGAYDISGMSSSTVKVKLNDSTGVTTTLATGTLTTDGTDGRIDFVINKDLIPQSLSAFNQSPDFPTILYFVTIEDADSKIQVRKLISIEDIDGTANGGASPVVDAFDFQYTPTTPSDWTPWTDSGLAPTVVGGALDDIGQRLNEIVGALTFKGTIAIPADFPTSAFVEDGFTYRVTATVTDNDATKTNTGQSFINGDEIAWNGTDWSALGNAGVASVNGQSGIVVLDLGDIDDVTLSGEAQGDIVYRGATDFNNLSAGTAGKFLKTNGAGADPSWETPTGTDATKLPLAGGTMSGALNMGNQILLAPLDPTASTHVGDRDYNDARYAELSGATMAGALAMGNQTLSAPLDPSAGTHVGDRDYNDARYDFAQSDNNQTGTSYTLVLADGDNKTVFMNDAASNVLTIPTNASVAFPVGTKINVIMEGAGVTTITAIATVTLNTVSAGSGAVNNQFQGVTLEKRATNTWIATGDIATVA